MVRLSRMAGAPEGNDEMSLDFYLEYEDEITKERVTAFSANITHNLNKMADEAGIYKHLWHPCDIGITRAVELIKPLSEGLSLLKSDPERFEKFNAPNGWGLYKHFVPFVEECLNACKQYPSAKVSTST